MALETTAAEEDRFHRFKLIGWWDQAKLARAKREGKQLTIKVGFDPTAPEANPPLSKMGGGAYGPNLTGGDVNGQFPPPNGESDSCNLS